MSIFNEFLYTILVPKIEDKFEEYLDTLQRDYSEWVYVDGEEGDFGVVKYYDNGVLICSKLSNGGDDDWVDFTQEGIKKLTELLNFNKE